jgi:MtN3 and saliva related transmembrane protein
MTVAGDYSHSRTTPPQAKSLPKRCEISPASQEGDAHAAILLASIANMDKTAWIEAIGWVSTGLLLATLVRQVYTQWQSGAVSGVSKWLFMGQMAASIGFMTYSFLLRNWVFMGSNAAILLVAIVGQVMYARNRRGKRGKPSGKP